MALEGGAGGRVLVTRNGGASWLLSLDPNASFANSPVLRLRQLALLPGNYSGGEVAVAVGANGTVVRAAPVVGQEEMCACTASHMLVLLICPRSVALWTNANWTVSQGVVTSNDLNAVSAINATALVAVGDVGTILRSLDEGCAR